MLIETRFTSSVLFPLITENKLQTIDKNLLNKIEQLYQGRNTESNMDWSTATQQLVDIYEAYKDSLLEKAVLIIK